MNDAQSDVSVARRPLRTISEIRSFFRTNVADAAIGLLHKLAERLGYDLG